MPHRLFTIVLATVLCGSALAGPKGEEATGVRDQSGTQPVQKRGDSADEPFTIVTFGDSTTAPRVVDGNDLRVYTDILRGTLEQQGKHVQVINAGVGGHSTKDARKRFEKDVLAHEPGAVVIQFGINDAAVDVWRDPPEEEPRVSLEEYKANLRHFIGELEQAGAKVVLMTPNPLRWTDRLRELYGKPPYDPESEQGMNALLQDHAAAVRTVANQDGVPLVDIYKAFEAYGEEPGQAVNDLLLDGMHPNTKGQALVAELLLEKLTPLVR